MTGTRSRLFHRLEPIAGLRLLAVGLWLMAAASPGSGQTLSCAGSVANQPILRQESNAEPAADILISCTGTLVGAQTGSQTLSLYVNGAAITSRSFFRSSAHQHSYGSRATGE